jgi:hypothetical protein
VLTGVEFDEWTSDMKRRLFVAMTRARIRLTLVVESDAESRIVASLSGV